MQALEVMLENVFIVNNGYLRDIWLFWWICHFWLKKELTQYHDTPIPKSVAFSCSKLLNAAKLHDKGTWPEHVSTVKHAMSLCYLNSS